MSILIDTHCHLNFKDFKDDADEVITRTLAGETDMILVGSEFKTSSRAVDYTNKYDSGVYAAIGLHPIHLENVLAENHDENGDYKFVTHAEEFNYDAYYNLAKENKKVVAIGEIGLDYFHIDKNQDTAAVKEKQRTILKQLLLLAHNLDLPVIIHCREAHEDLLPLLKEFKEKYKKDDKREWGVIHCFSGDEALAREYIVLGLKISFTGLITFAHNWDEVIKNIPLEKIMIETDAPYMAPIPYRGKRNEPLYVRYVAEKIAELKGLKFEEVAEKTYQNAKDLFGIDKISHT
jgi:TatD DNase family protein